MDVYPIAAIIGAFTGTTSLAWQIIWKRFNLEVSAPSRNSADLPQFTWYSDAAECFDEKSTAHSKWIRIVNKSFVPITIYEVEISSHMSELILTSNAAITQNMPIGETDEDYLRTDAHLPLTLDSFQAFEGYLLFRGYGEKYPEGTPVKISVKTARRKKSCKTDISYTCGDL